ncbi:hypothetical protein ZWY2020_008974 [Hordeum vulgare]|nr:hypothetical protein ZWY2020_008974 [Hordeum vulgare]
MPAAQFLPVSSPSHPRTPSETPPTTPSPPPTMANFELDPEFFLPPGHNIIDGGPDRLPRTYTTPAVPITRRHERFVIADVHPAPPAHNLVQGCLMLLGVSLDFRNIEDLRAAVNTFGEFHHWVSDDPYLVRSIVFASFPDDQLVPRSISFSEYAAWGGGVKVSWSAPVYILGAAPAELPPNNEDPMPLNGNPHPLAGQLVNDNLPPYPALRWNAVPPPPEEPVAPAAADDGGWGQPLTAADGGGWEPEEAPEAPPPDPAQDQESMVIDQPSLSSSDSVHELVDLDPQPQGDIEAEVADIAPPVPNLDVILAAHPSAPDADMAPVFQAPAAEPEEEVQGEDEAQDDNPLAIVPYKPPQVQSDNLFVGAARVFYGPPLPPVLSWSRTFDAYMGAATSMHVLATADANLRRPL